MFASSCIEAIESGCQDIADLWEWGWDWTKLLRQRPGDVISTVVWTVPPELTQGTPTNTGIEFYVPIGNATGVAGNTYAIFADVTTAQGMKAKCRINITLNDITAP